MAVGDSGLVSDPHATVDITVHDGSSTDMPSGLRCPKFSQRLYQMDISCASLCWFGNKKGMWLAKCF